MALKYLKARHPFMFSEGMEIIILDHITMREGWDLTRPESVLLYAIPFPSLGLSFPPYTPRVLD